MNTNEKTYFMPTRPYSIVDAVNRVTLATGGVSYAMRGENADYNGHFVVVERNDYAYGGHLETEEAKESMGWRALYTWSGTQYLARATNFRSAFDAAMREHARGALGSSVRVKCHTAEQVAVCEASGLLPWSPEAEKAVDATWRTPLYGQVGDAIWYESKMGVPAVSMLVASSSAEEFKAKVEKFMNRVDAQRLAAKTAKAEESR